MISSVSAMEWRSRNILCLLWDLYAMFTITMFACVKVHGSEMRKINECRDWARLLALLRISLLTPSKSFRYHTAHESLHVHCCAVLAPALWHILWCVISGWIPDSVGWKDIQHVNLAVSRLWVWCGKSSLKHRVTKTNVCSICAPTVLHY